MLTTDNTTTNQLGGLEHAHVFGGCGKSHLQRRSELAEGALADRKLADDRTAGGVRQGVKHTVEPGGSINNHMVYYTIWFYDFKREAAALVPPLAHGQQNPPVDA